mmetsp:Transcript_22379/g.33065  ORF Transcript_22379/g.33065 Transcript_22379/m.33065 type:complete len:177 (+) Transcript_22379:27-557(+)
MPSLSASFLFLASLILIADAFSIFQLGKLSRRILYSNVLMSEGEKKKCVPCQGLDTSDLLSRDEAQQEINSNMPLWEIKEQHGVPCIFRSYVAKNFQAALDSINAIGAIAEHEGHHPDLKISKYREVEIVLWTHSLGGITKNDIDLAKIIDTEVKILYSPKWLRENTNASSTTASS